VSFESRELLGMAAHILGQGLGEVGRERLTPLKPLSRKAKGCGLEASIMQRHDARIARS